MMLASSLRRLSEQGRGWAGRCALPPAPGPSGRVPCAARPHRVRFRTLALAWPARRSLRRAYARSSTSLAVAPPCARRDAAGGLRCSAPSTRAPACPPAALRAPLVACGQQLGAARKAVGGCAVARLMRRRGAQGSWPRAQRASCSDSSRLFERSERSERSEFRDGPRVRAPQGSPARSAGRRITSDAAHPPAALLTQSSSKHERAKTRCSPPATSRCVSAAWWRSTTSASTCAVAKCSR